MAEDERPPGADVVDVAIAIGVPNVRALPANQKGRVAAHGTKGADRRIDSSRDELFRPLLQAAGLIKIADHDAVLAFRGSSYAVQCETEEFIRIRLIEEGDLLRRLNNV